MSGSELSFSNVNTLEMYFQKVSLNTFFILCSEPLVMNLDIRVLGFTSTKVKRMSVLSSRLIVTSIDVTEYFVLVISSAASTKPVLNLSHMSLTESRYKIWLVK